MDQEKDVLICRSTLPGDVSISVTFIHMQYFYPAQPILDYIFQDLLARRNRKIIQASLMQDQNIISKPFLAQSAFG